MHAFVIIFSYTASLMAAFSDGCFLNGCFWPNKIPLGETRCLGCPYFTYWLPKHPVFWFTLTLTQSVGPPMVTYPSLCSLCVTYRTLCHAIGHQVLPALCPNPLTREAEDFPRVGNHSKHVPPAHIPILIATNLP